MGYSKHIEKAIHRWFEEVASGRIKDLKNMATWDLWFGPASREDFVDSGYLTVWPGYVPAIRELEGWASDNGQTIWITEDGDYTTTRPGSRDEDHYSRIDPREALAVVFESLIHNGGMSL